MAMNDPRFLAPMGERLRRLGLTIQDVGGGRYVRIPLDNARPEPEEFSEYGEFDTFTVLNPHDLPDGAEIWVYFNKNNPESRMPLYNSTGSKAYGIIGLETIADRFYIQHADAYPGVTLHVIIGGDLRAMRVQSLDRGTISIADGENVEAWAHDGNGNKITSEDLGGGKRGLHTSNPVLESVDFASDARLELVRLLLASIDGKDFATQTTLAALEVLLTSLDSKDFATETTLAALEGKDFATETKLEAVRALLASIDGKDFATQTTLAALEVLLTSLDSKDFATETTLAALEGKDFATETKLEAVRSLLASIDGKDFATETTLASVISILGDILTELQTQTLLLQDIKDNTTPAP